MTAAELLHHLVACGFTVRAEGGTLYVRPAYRLTPGTRSLVADHKDALLALVQRGGWVGWFKPGKGRWRSVVHGAQRDEVQARLIDYRVPGINVVEKVVLPQGKHPSQ